MKHSWGVFHYLLKCRQAVQGLDHAIFLHGAEVASIEAHLPYFLHSPLLQNGVPDFGVRHQQFINTDAAAITSEVAARASLAHEQAEPLEIFSCQAKAA